MAPPSGYFDVRLPYDERRELLWKTLCRFYFNRLIRPADHVLELGAGYAHFINNVQCKQRTAIDQSPVLREYAHSQVAVKIGDVADLDFLQDNSVNFVFASNLFEHLSQSDFSRVLAQIKRKLAPGGTLNILQPNYRRAYREYFDDYTHVAIYSDISLCDFLRVNGYEIIESHPGFLPLTIKSRFPVFPWLIRLYLLLPWKPMGKQMLVRATPAAAGERRT